MRQYRAELLLLVPFLIFGAIGFFSMMAQDYDQEILSFSLFFVTIFGGMVYNLSRGETEDDRDQWKGYTDWLEEKHIIRREFVTSRNILLGMFLSWAMIVAVWLSWFLFWR